jgi:hypothetical protein
MWVESLDELADVLSDIKVGQRLDLERVNFRSLWPRPPLPYRDDYLSEEERAEQWCRAFGCTIRENFDPPKLVIDCISAERSPLPATKVDERSRDDMLLISGIGPDARSC